MKYIEGHETGPAFNLAFEQYAFDTLSLSDDLFMLWQNHDTVIVGLHQNTMQEINRSYIDGNKIPVIRRLSGGGAVFHDRGNLNFTFITKETDNSEIDFELSCKPIAEALISMGVPVEFSGRNDMSVEGKKFSGNARYFKDGRLMHHGTILFDVDMDKLAQTLKVSEDKLESKGVKSVRSRVVNLREYLDMTVEEFWAALREKMAANMAEYKLSQQDIGAIEDIKKMRYGTWEWNYGQSPAFSIEKKRRIEGFGSIRLCMNSEKGRITALATDGDYFGVKPFADVAKALTGVQLERGALQDALKELNLSDYYESLGMEQFVDLVLN